MEVAELIPGWERIIPRDEALSMLKDKRVPGIDPGEPEWKWERLTEAIRAGQAILGTAKGTGRIRILFREEEGCTHN